MTAQDKCVHFWPNATNSLDVRRTSRQGSCSCGYANVMAPPTARSSTEAMRVMGSPPVLCRYQFWRPIQSWPRVNAALVKTMNFMKSRRSTYKSCGQSIGKSCRHAGCASVGAKSGAIVMCSRSKTGANRFAGAVPVSPSRPGVLMAGSMGRRGSGVMSPMLNLDPGKGIALLRTCRCGRFVQHLQRHGAASGLFVHGGRDVHVRRAGSERARHHHVHLCRDRLVAELKRVHWHGQRPELFDLLARAEEERLAGAHRRAHRLLADARPVVAHVALHHDLAIFVELRHPERTRHHAITARDAARLARRLHDPIGRALDRVGRAHFRARGLLAMHT